MGKIPIGGSSDNSESSTDTGIQYGPYNDYLAQAIFGEMYGFPPGGVPAYPGPAGPPPAGPPLAPGQPPTFPGAPTNPYGPGPIPDMGRRPPPVIQPVPDLGGVSGPGDNIPSFPGPAPVGPAYPSPTWPGQPTVAESMTAQVGGPVDYTPYMNQLNGMVQDARTRYAAAAQAAGRPVPHTEDEWRRAYLPMFTPQNFGPNGIQSFGAHEFQGNPEINQAMSRASVDIMRASGALPPAGPAPAGGTPQVSTNYPPPYQPPAYNPEYPSGVAPITQEQFMSTQPAGYGGYQVPPPAPVPPGGLSSFAAEPVASPLQTVQPRGGTINLMDAPVYPSPPPPGSPPGTPIVGQVPRGRNPLDNPLPPGQNPPNPPTVDGYSGPLQPWQVGPGFGPTVSTPYVPGSEVQNPNLPPGWPGGPPGVMESSGIAPNQPPRAPVTTVGPHPPPIVVTPRPPVGPPIIPPGGGPPGPVGPPGPWSPGNLYAGGSSGARQLTGQGVYDQLARMLHDPGYDQQTRNAMTIEGQNAARAGFAGAGAQIQRHAATTGNSQGVVAGLSELGRAQAGAMGQQARQNQIDQFKEAQRQREWATQGLGALYGGESSFLSNQFGQQANIQGRVTRSSSRNRARVDTPLFTL